MRHLTAADVERLLPMPAAIEAARDTARTVAEDRIHAADRIWHRPAGMPGTIGVMPAHLPDDGTEPAIFTTKLVGVFPAADPSVNGVIVALDATSANPLAIIDAAAVTQARTAAGSGLSIDLLARADATTLAVIGAGAQGWAHLLAAMATRPISDVRIWNRTPARADEVAQRARRLPGIERVRAVDTPAAAAAGADVVCVCTNSPTPVLHAADVDPGTHVTAIGAFTSDTRELAADLIARADAVVVDDRAAAVHEAGDILLAIDEGVVAHDVVTADLAELVTGRITIDRTDDALTVYKSVGTSAMDAVAVRHLLRADADRRLVVYGTLAPDQPNAAVLDPSTGIWQRGSVEGERLADGWHGYPGLRLPGPGTGGPSGSVPVHVLTTETTETIDWAVVDAYEGPGYRRRRTVATLEDGTGVVSNVYVLAEGR